MGTVEDMVTARRYRDRAEELRTIASGMFHLESRATVGNVASMYDAMAKRLEARATEKEPPA